ncbi:MAG: NADH-quinone oxidoreductase subunit NuoH [candidate division Zixibacteria bacterium]|nr:NADH-quinone oxidoreductase subunit NuoH [candidate division Zixibacteria bacterium]
MVTFIIITLIKILIVFVFFLLMIAYLTWLERKLLGHFQVRLGPMRVGPHGLLQPFADGIKLLFKEDVTPAKVNKFIYNLAPLLTFIPALIIMAVIPFGDQIKIFGQSINLVISDFNMGILYVFAVTSLSVYGIVLAGWSSNNKYSLLGGLRSSAQMISYEVSLALSLIGVFMIAGSLSLVEIVKSQDKLFSWFIFRQPLGFILYLVCAIAETNRAPFDLPEADNELVAGYYTEYSSMKFAMFFLGEYGSMINVSALATTLFLGGWQGPFLPPVLWFLIKVCAFLFFYIWVRATLPRFRYDQLMNFGWKVLLPLTLLNILLTATIMVL